MEMPCLKDGRGDREAGLLVKASVMLHVGLPVRVGLGPTRTLSKIANAMAKKGVGGGNGVADLNNPAERETLLAQWPAGAVWGVAAATEAKLAANGVRTALDIARMDPRHARAIGTVVLEKLVREMNGECCLDPATVVEARATASATRQTGLPVTCPDALHEAVCRRIMDASVKLRVEGLQAGVMAIMAHGSVSRSDPKPPSWTWRARLDPPTSDPGTMAAIARRMIEASFKNGDAYTKTGVFLEELSPAGSGQSSFLAEPVDPRRTAAIAAMDALNARFGRGTASIASAGLGPRASHTRRDVLSKRWTTRLSDVPVAY
jgi:DNA polymerase V